MEVMNSLRNMGGLAVERSIDLRMMDVKDRVLWHLDRDFTRPIRDPLWNNIYVSDGMLALVNSHEFQQLSRIKQLGLRFDQ